MNLAVLCLIVLTLNLIVGLWLLWRVERVARLVKEIALTINACPTCRQAKAFVPLTLLALLLCSCAWMGCARLGLSSGQINWTTNDVTIIVTPR